MTIREINQLIQDSQSLKAIASSYSEIAHLKIKKIRAAVERNRLFFDELSSVYGLVKGFALKKGVYVKKPKKRLCMILTSNYRFYGQINLSLINFFLGSTLKLPDVDKIIIGKAGMNYFRASKILPHHQEVLLKDDMPTSSELSELVNTISQYNQVLVFYSKLKSLLIQQATFTDITATSQYTVASHKTPHFIFEPQLPKLLTFFDTSILTLLLEQTFLESELSRTASRFISMDQAQLEANKFIKQYQNLKAQASRSLENLKILENFATLLATRRHRREGNVGE